MATLGTQDAKRRQTTHLRKVKHCEGGISLQVKINLQGMLITISI
jgi:hypothetical protein